MARPLFDTCILIDMMRKTHEAVALLEESPNGSAISVLTLQELIVGLRPSEVESFEHLVALFDKIPVDADVARMSGKYMKAYLKSHGLDSNDAVIAATATVGGFDLVTLNLKHFPMLPDLIRPY